MKNSVRSSIISLVVISSFGCGFNGQTITEIPTGSESTGNVIVRVTQPRTNLCGGGFTEFPPELSSKRLDEAKSLDSEPEDLRFPNKFYAFVFSSLDHAKDASDDFTCDSVKPTNLAGINFLDREGILIIRRFVSAQMASERSVATAEQDISSGNSKRLTKLPLCIGHRCGLSKSETDIQTFENTSSSEIQSSSTYSDTLLLIGTMNALRELYQSEASRITINDEALWGILRDARKYAVAISN